MMSNASWSSGRVSSCSNLAVSTDASAIPECRSASSRNTAFLVFASTIVNLICGAANRKGIAGDPLPDPMSMSCRHWAEPVGRPQPARSAVGRRPRPWVTKVERGEIDLGVPLGKKREIGVELAEHRWRDRAATLPGAFKETVLEGSAGHVSRSLLRRGAHTSYPRSGSDNTTWPRYLTTDAQSSDRTKVAGEMRVRRARHFSSL